MPEPTGRDKRMALSFCADWISSQSKPESSVVRSLVRLISKVRAEEAKARTKLANLANALKNCDDCGEDAAQFCMDCRDKARTEGRTIGVAEEKARVLELIEKTPRTCRDLKGLPWDAAASHSDAHDACHEALRLYWLVQDCGQAVVRDMGVRGDQAAPDRAACPQHTVSTIEATESPNDYDRQVDEEGMTWSSTGA